jgi:hypothetical protein
MRRKKEAERRATEKASKLSKITDHAQLHRALDAVMDRVKGKDAPPQHEGFYMQFNSAQTWDSNSYDVRLAWLKKRGLPEGAAERHWDRLPERIQIMFVNWHRSVHNV